MPFRFKAAAGGTGARAFASRFSKRLALLSNHAGEDALSVAAAGGVAAARPALPAAVATVSRAATRRRTLGVGAAGPVRSSVTAAAAPTRRFAAAPAGVTPMAVEQHDHRHRQRGVVVGRYRAVSNAVAPPGTVKVSGCSGRSRWRGLATTPAMADADPVAEDAAQAEKAAGDLSGRGESATTSQPRPEGDARGRDPQHAVVGGDCSGDQVAPFEKKGGAGVAAGADADVDADASGGSGGGGSGSSSGDDSSAPDPLARFNKELKQHVRLGRGEEAAALIARMRETGGEAGPTARNYTSAINACKNGDTAQWRQALDLLREVVAGGGGGGVTPDAYHYTAAMKACGRAKQWEQVSALRSEMESLGITPNLSYYHWAINVASRTGVDGKDSEGGATGGDIPRGWMAVKDLVAEMAEKEVTPQPLSYELVRKAKYRLQGPRSNANKSGDGGGGGGGEIQGAGDDVVDGGLEWAYKVLGGIEGAPQPPPLAPKKSASQWQQSQKQGEEDGGGGDDGGGAGVDNIGPALSSSSSPSPDASQSSDSDKKQTAPAAPAAAAATTSADPPGSLEECNEELKKLARLGQGQEAAALVFRMRETGGALAPTLKSYTSAINACGNGSRVEWRQALALLREAAAAVPEKGDRGGDRVPPPNAFHYTAAIKACGNAHQWKQIPPLLSEMESRGMCPPAEFYNWAIKMATMPKTGPRMRSLMIRGGGWRVTTELDHGRGGGGSDGGDGDLPQSPQQLCGWEAATALLREMVSKGVAPKSTTYTLVMTACRRDGVPEQALAVLREMQERAAAAAAAAAAAGEIGGEGDSAGGLPPSPADFGGGADTDREEGEEEDDGGDSDVDGGDARLDVSAAEMEAAAAAAAAAAAGWGPRNIGPAYRQSPSRSQSLGWRRDAQVGPSLIHYSAVMSAFAEQPGGWKHILALVQEMEAGDVPPNVYTYNKAIVACGREGQWAEAVALFRRMSRRGVSPDSASFLAAIQACGRGQQWALAVALLREMSPATNTTASKTDGKAAAVAAVPTVSAPTIEAYTSAISACGYAGQWEVAIGLLREVTDGHAAAAAAAAAAATDVGVAADLATAGDGAAAGGDAWSGDGDAGGAPAGAAEEEEPPLLLPSVAPAPLRPDVLLYNAAIQACGMAGQWQRSLELLAEIPKVGLSPTVVSYNSAIAACGKANQWEQAVALLEEMRTVGLTPVSSTFLPAIEACQRAGKGKLAYALIKERDIVQRRMRDSLAAQRREGAGGRGSGTQLAHGQQRSTRRGAR